MTKRVLLAGIFHETHTFLEGTTPVADFSVRRGEELLLADDDGSPLAGVMQVARECGWEVLPTIDLRATPSAIVEDSVLEAFWLGLREVFQREAPRGIDGIYLILHGAMCCQSYPDVEGEVLDRIHRLVDGANIPVCGVLDLHCNYSPRMARYSDCLIAYRENPHTDAQESAMRAARLLDRILTSGKRPVTLFEQPPLVWPPTGVGTANDPMKSLEALARQIESAHPEILAANVLAGYSFADTPDTGASFSVVTLGDAEVARRELKRLSQLALEQRELGNKVDMPIEEAMRRLPGHHEGPVLLVEPSDNIGGGAPGDGTGVLRALIEHQVDRAAVVINDPESVTIAAKLPPGAHLPLKMGGKASKLGGAPVQLDVVLESTSDGHFELEDRHSHLASMCGVHINMGPCVVVRHAGIRILLTSRKTPPFDLGQLRSQGIIPEQQRVIGVKAAVAHRRAYDKIAKASYTVDTPGPCSSNLKLFPFQRLRRPIYPLDKISL